MGFMYIFIHQGAENQSLEDGSSLELILLDAAVIDADFDATLAECYDLADKAKILEVIARHRGGIEGFNVVVTRLLRKLSQAILFAATAGEQNPIIGLESIASISFEISYGITFDLHNPDQCPPVI